MPVWNMASTLLFYLIFFPLATFRQRSVRWKFLPVDRLFDRSVVNFCRAVLQVVGADRARVNKKRRCPEAPARKEDCYGYITIYSKVSHSPVDKETFYLLAGKTSSFQEFLARPLINDLSGFLVDNPVDKVTGFFILIN